MKNSYRVVGALLCAALLAGCGNKQGNSPSASESVPTTAKKESGKTAVVLYHKAALFIEEDNAMVYKTTASIGDMVKWHDIVKKSVRKSDGQEREFAKISVDGEEYWIQTVFVAGNAVTGLVASAETILYSKADATGATSDILPQYAIVAVHSDSETNGFVPVSAYIEGTRYVTVEKRFVKKENISVDNRDVRAMQLFAIASTEKNEVVKKELLKNALEANSQYQQRIEEALSALEPKAALETEPLSTSFTVNDDNVNVRDYPDTTDGAVVAQLQRDQTVTSVARLSAAVELAGMTGHWIQIVEPAGWVFSSFLIEADEQ